MRVMCSYRSYHYTAHSPLRLNELSKSVRFSLVINHSMCKEIKSRKAEVTTKHENNHV